MSLHGWCKTYGGGGHTRKKVKFLKCLGLFACHGGHNIKIAPGFLPSVINILYNLSYLRPTKTIWYGSQIWIIIIWLGLILSGLDRTKLALLWAAKVKAKCQVVNQRSHVVEEKGLCFLILRSKKKKKILSLSYVGKILQIYPNRALVSPLNFSETLSRGWSR